MNPKIEQLTSRKILTAIHQTKHPLAGQTCQVRPFVKNPYIKNLPSKMVNVLDYYDRIHGGRWLNHTLQDPGCLVYLLRTQLSWYLRDDEVALCMVTDDGEEKFFLLHDTEIDKQTGGMLCKQPSRNGYQTPSAR